MIMMDRKFRHALAALFVLLVSSCGLFEGGTDIRNLSGFDLFTYSYQPVFGPPPVGEMMSVRIENIGEGEYQVSMWELAFGDAEKDTCLAYWGTDTCYVELDLGIRNLTSSERQMMLDVFKDVEVIRNKDLQCNRVSIDPFVIHHFTWDDFHVSDYACSEPRLGKAQRNALLEFLETLLSN